MRGFMGRMGPIDQKGSVMNGGYHTLLGHCFTPVPNKEFSYIKSTNLSVRSCQSYENNDKISSQKVQEMNAMNVASGNTNKKKKKRRRRRRRKNKQPPQRTRTVSEQTEDFICFEDPNETESSDSFIPNKKVHFETEDRLCQVHPMVAWSFAYQAARRGPWEEYARDRCRFKKRVADTESLIGHVFTMEHRSRIYNQRCLEPEMEL